MPVPLSVMSYNVRYDNPAESSHPWRRRRNEVASVVRFHGPDVVGLQEALHGQLADLRERLPRYEWLSAGREEPECAGEYAAIGYDRARFNLEAEGTVWLSETPSVRGSRGWDAELPRLVRYVRLREEPTGVEFYLFNTHFDHRGETARRRSAAMLLERVDRLARNEPVVVTGDFNCRAGSPPYRTLTGRDRVCAGRTLRDAHHAARGGHHGPTTTVTDFRNLVPDKKIDHVLVSSGVEVLLHGVCADTFGNGRYPSDHLPVLVALSISGDAATPGAASAEADGEGGKPADASGEHDGESTAEDDARDRDDSRGGDDTCDGESPE